MNDTLLGALIGASATLLGVTGAAGIGWVQGRARELKQRRNVRTLLRLENAHNLKALAAFWDSVTLGAGREPGVGYGGDELEFEKRLRLANLTLPAWGHVMWESQVASLADALSRHELERAYSLHTDLDTFAEVRSRLQEAFNTNEGKKLAADFTNWIEHKRVRMEVSDAYGRDLLNALREFNQRTFPLWQECMGIANTVRQYGNPIPEGGSIATASERFRRLLPRRPTPTTLPSAP